MKEMTVLSLFSGAGGLDLGFHLEGFDIRACIELDSYACKTLELNKGKYLSSGCKIYCDDITKLDPAQVKKEIGAVDFIIGGPPCQSFSAAGRRAGGVYGVNDTRGSLFWFYAQFLKEFRPKGFLFENVKGILQANKNRDWEVIKQSFAELGYRLTYRVLDAAEYGTPQHRERVIMVGWFDELPFKFPKPIFGPNSKDKKPFVTPKAAFADIDDPNEIVPKYSGKYGHLLADIPPGLNYAFYTERMGHPHPLFAWRSKFSGFLYKLDPNEPSKTLVAHQGKYDGPFHWRNRKLNIPELIRLQGFPIDYQFAGSRVAVEKQIGNSVAPILSRYLAKAVSSQFFNSDVSVELLEPEEVMKRPKKMRIPKQSTKKKVVNPHATQFSIFDVPPIEWPTMTLNLAIHEDSFDNICVLDHGHWAISAIRRNTDCDVKLSIEVNFIEPIAKTFRRITCNLQTNDILDFSIAWDFIHAIVNSSCSYENLLPLYGHFTEPYPKFTVKTSTNFPDGKITFLMKKMEDFSFLAKTHHYSEFEALFAKTNVLDMVRLLRGRGVDIRVHETNRTIPQEHFRICYPFCMPSWQPTYTSWADAGEHKTGDLDITALMSGAIQ